MFAFSTQKGARSSGPFLRVAPTFCHLFRLWRRRISPSTRLHFSPLTPAFLVFGPVSAVTISHRREERTDSWPPASADEAAQVILMSQRRQFQPLGVYEVETGHRAGEPPTTKAIQCGVRRGLAPVDAAAFEPYMDVFANFARGQPGRNAESVARDIIVAITALHGGADRDQDISQLLEPGHVDMASLEKSLEPPPSVATSWPTSDSASAMPTQESLVHEPHPELTSEQDSARARASAVLETTTWNFSKLQFRLGGGGSGVAYKVFSKSLFDVLPASLPEPGRFCDHFLSKMAQEEHCAVLKLLSRDEPRSIREVEALRATRHPNLMRLLDADTGVPDGSCCRTCPAECLTSTWSVGPCLLFGPWQQLPQL